MRKALTFIVVSLFLVLGRSTAYLLVGHGRGTGGALSSFIARASASTSTSASARARCVRPLTPLSATSSSPTSEGEYATLLSGVQRATPAGSVVVIKYGGHAMENDEAKTLFCQDIAALCRTGVLPVIVHGGGPQIAKMLASLSIESRFENGLRVTDDKTMEVAQMVLCGSINKEIVGKISSQAGVRGAIGLCGLDAGLIKARIKNPALGLVGEPTTVNTQVVRDLLSLKLVPVIAPVGCNEDGGTALNINADTAAGAVAEALGADRLLLLTDIVGVLDKDKKLIEVIPSSEFKKLIQDGTISGGMIPKLETAVQAVEAGVKVVSIMDGRVKNCILRALSGDVFGTQIVKQGR